MSHYLVVIVAIAGLISAQISYSQGAATLGLAVDNSEKSLIAVVENSQAAGDLLTARTARELLFLLTAYEASNERLLNEAFESVNEEHRQFIGTINSAVENLNRDGIKTSNQSERVMDQAYRSVKDLTLDSFPTVLRYRGSVILPGQEADIRLRVYGSNLMQGEPYLELDGESYSASLRTAQDLLFTIPRKVFDHDDIAIVTKNGALHLPYEAGGFLGFFTEKKEVVNEIAFFVLPNTLGRARVQYEALGTARRRIVETGNWHDNAPTGCRSFSHGQAARGGRIAADGRQNRRYYGNDHGEHRAMTKGNGDAYMVICVTPDDPGKNGQSAPYRYMIEEYWDEPTSTPIVEALKLGWRAESQVEIGNGVDKLLVTFTDFTGRKTKHTPADNPSTPYAHVSFDDRGMVVLRPIIPKYLPAL